MTNSNQILRFLKAGSITIATLLILMIGGAAASPVVHGVVDGAEECGGSSPMVRMELTNCTTAPCDVETSVNYEISITFLAGESTQSVNWLVYIYIPNGGVNRLSNKIVGGTISNGTVYRMADMAAIPDRYNGVDGELSVMIMNDETGSRMACGIFPVIVAAHEVP